MVNGTVRAIEQVGTNVWLGGKFTQVKRRNGTVDANVSNLAVFDSQSDQYLKITWLSDTSGSVQVVGVMDSQLVIGGYFWEVADQPADQPNDSCGHGRSNELDPNNQCQTRKGIAAYSFEGEPKLSDWSPTYAGKYSLVWALHVDGERLHTGGKFLTVNGVTQNYYARLS
jgi:hypothetical protein